MAARRNYNSKHYRARLITSLYYWKDIWFFNKLRNFIFNWYHYNKFTLK